LLYDYLTRLVWRTALFLETGRLDSPHVFKKKSMSIFHHPPLLSFPSPSLTEGASAVDSNISPTENACKGFRRINRQVERNQRTQMKIKMKIIGRRDNITGRGHGKERTLNHNTLLRTKTKGKNKEWNDCFSHLDPH
jgi:hypothetical protein